MLREEMLKDIKGNHRKFISSIRYEEHPLYKELKQFSTETGHSQTETDKNSSAIEDKEEEKDGVSRPFARQSWRRSYDDLTEIDVKEMLIDEIFALYLYRTSRHVSESFYRKVLSFIILFRNFLAAHGFY